MKQCWILVMAMFLVACASQNAKSELEVPVNSYIKNAYDQKVDRFFTQMKVYDLVRFGAEQAIAADPDAASKGAACFMSKMSNERLFEFMAETYKKHYSADALDKAISAQATREGTTFWNFILFTATSGKLGKALGDASSLDESNMKLVVEDLQLTKFKVASNEAKLSAPLMGMQIANECMKQNKGDDSL